MGASSKLSAERLATCHPHLIEVFAEVVKTHDCTILYGHRGEEEQNEAVRTGHSKKKFPDSRHNSSPSQAVDAIPYPFKGWEDRGAMAEFAKFVIETASKRGIELRWGGDWNGNGDWRDERFCDMPHFELRYRV